MPDRFFQPGPLDADEFVLSPEESKHAVVVLRKREGDSVILFNGEGGEIEAEIFEAGKKSCHVRKTAVLNSNRELPLEVCVASCLPKMKLDKWMIQKLVELGASCFLPLTSQRSVVVPKEKKGDKWRDLIIEACKQCGRNLFMKVEAARDFEEFIPKIPKDDFAVLLHPSSEMGFWEALPAKAPKRLWLIIGPEGGFSDEEVLLARNSGLKLLRFGASLLRIETAVLASVSALRARYGN